MQQGETDTKHRYATLENKDWSISKPYVYKNITIKEAIKSTKIDMVIE